MKTAPLLKRDAWRQPLRGALMLLAASFALLSLYAVLTGFPLVLWGHAVKMKNLKPLFLMFSGSLLLRSALHPEGPWVGIRKISRAIGDIAARPQSLTILLISAAILFTWQQVTEYLALEINFIPFGFYDYMLHYFFQGKINFTGELHGFYHVNNILFLLAPVWKIVPSPLLLIGLYGPLAALAAWPLYEYARRELDSRGLAFLTAFIYLNYRYLQNALQVNFSVEIFYPLILFSAVLMAVQKKWAFYYLLLSLGLSVKEDSFLYFAALGGIVCFTKEETGRLSRNRVVHGLITIGLSFLYFAFVTKVFIPWTGSNILKGDLENFLDQGDTHKAVISNLLTQPVRILTILFGSPEKVKTYLNLFSRLMFIPLFSPLAFFVLIPIAPLFMHMSGESAHFVDLRLYYGLTVIPFVFIAFVGGLSRLIRLAGDKKRTLLLSIACPVLIILNAGHFRTEKFTAQDRKSIQLAKSIPAGTNLVTHGHLLPYVGHRPFNYYFAEPWELVNHKAHAPFMHADYYLLDKNVNFYPMDEGYVDQKIAALKENPDYQLIHDDGVRFLFQKKHETT